VKHDVPVALDDGGTVYVPGSTMVRCDGRAPSGLGQRRKAGGDGKIALRSLRRDVGNGPRVELPDGRAGRVEGYQAETERLRAELAAALATIASMDEMRAAYTRAVVDEMMTDLGVDR
jgi:hypothetical protein